MKSSSTSIRLLAYSRSKEKSALIKWLKKYCILRRIRAKRVVGEKIWLVLNTVGVSGVSEIPRRALHLLPYWRQYFQHSNWQKYVIKIWFLFLKTVNLIIYWIPLGLLQAQCPWKTILTIPIFRLISELRKVWRCRLGSS